MVSCLYKIVSRIVASRLKRVFGKLISTSHTTFLPDRQILYHVVVVNDIIYMDKRDKKECIMWKLGFEKAYDYMSLKYLRFMMRKLGF